MLVVGVQGCGDPKGVFTVPSITLNCPSSRCNCLCGPLPLLSAGALTNPYAFGRTPHSPVWVEDVFWEIRSVVSKETPLQAEATAYVVYSAYLSQIERADERTRTADLLITSVLAHVLDCTTASGNRLVYGVFDDLALSLCPLRTSSYQPGCSTIAVRFLAVHITRRRNPRRLRLR